MTTPRDIIIHAGQTFTLSLDYAGTAGRGQRMHIRASDAAADVIAILSHNGDANARVIYDGTDSLDITIGASVNGGWLVGANRVEWVYDIEDYDLSDTDDVVIAYRGKVIVYGNRTRPEDVTPSAALPSGDGRYVRFDTDAQGLSDAQKLAARTNIGADTGGGGSGDVVGPASATDDHIAAFDGVTGKLIKQGGVTATAVASHLSNTSNPHSVTAAQVGADPAGTAASAVSTHAGAADPHGDRAYADGLAANYATAAQGALADSAVQDIAAEIHAASADSIADADESGFWQSASSALRKITWANIKAAIKTYADTLYAAISHTHALSGITDSGATSGQVPTWNGTAWVPQTPSGASPGGSGSELQYRGGSSTFGGASGTHWDAVNGRLSIGAGTSPAGMLHTRASAASVISAVLQGAASQTANLQEWRDSAGTLLSGINSGGSILLGGTVQFRASSNRTFYSSGGGTLLTILGGNGGAQTGSSGTFGWTVSATDSTLALDTALVRAAAAVVGITNGSTGGGAIEFTAMTAPSAPSAGKGRAWFEDNGSGKLRYMVRFPSGAAQQIAIEP